MLGAVPAAAIRTTHVISARGELVAHWTINDPEECGLVGDGTLTVKFQTVKAKAIPYIDRYQRNGKGSWIIGVPLPPHLIKDMPAIKATGSFTRVDNATRRPMSDGTPCKPPDKSGCGVFPLPSKARGDISRYDRRHIGVDLSTTFPSLDTCHTGSLSLWSQRSLTGGGEDGQVLVKMPKPSVLKRRRLLKLSGRSHKQTTSTDALNPGSPTVSDDVTRKVTVTFKRR